MDEGRWMKRRGRGLGGAAVGLGLVLATGPAAADEGVAAYDAPMGAGLQLTAEIEPDAAVTCADDEQIFGIDVSKWQGEIDWAQVAADGVDFAIIRATHGTSIIDEWFDYNWEQAHAHGIVAGVYQYFEPAEDPIVQADLMLDMMGELQPGDLPPVIDVESATNSTPAQTAAAVGAWIAHVEAATGVEPIIYTGRYFWQDNVQSDEFVDYPLWIAHYTTDCPNIPSPWTRWAFHQYSSSGSVAGIGGAVDTNLFNGSYADLMAMTVQEVGVDAGVDATTCESIRGWAIGGDGPAEVQVAFDGGLVVTTTASLPHPDACDDAGCDHGYELEVPWSLRDGLGHEVQVSLADGTPLGDPSQVSCAADLAGSRLRPIDADALATWGFDPALDVLNLVDPGLDLDGAEFPATPLLVVGETTEGRWWIDDGLRRAVDDAAAAAWGLDAIAPMPWPDDSLVDVPLGPDLPGWRHAVQIDGATYVVDAPADGAANPDGDSGGGSNGDPEPDGDGSGSDGTGGDPTEGEAEGGGGGGCRIGGRGPGGRPGWRPGWLASSLLGLGWARRRRRP